MASEEFIIRCSFCGLRNEEVEHLIYGFQVAICTGCIDICNDVIKEYRAKKGFGEHK